MACYLLSINNHDSMLKTIQYLVGKKLRLDCKCLMKIDINGRCQMKINTNGVLEGSDQIKKFSPYDLLKSHTRFANHPQFGWMTFEEKTMENIKLARGLVKMLTLANFYWLNKYFFL